MCCRLLGKSNQLTFANLPKLLEQFAAVSPVYRAVAANIERFMNGQCLLGTYLAWVVANTTSWVF